MISTLLITFSLLGQLSQAKDVTSTYLPELNALRAQHDVAPAHAEPRLAKAAMEQATWAANNNSHGHDRPGRSYEQRVKDTGYPLDRLDAEHDAVGHSTFQEALAQWAIPRGRRASILGSDRDEVGIAQAYGPSGPVWYMAFGRSRQNRVVARVPARFDEAQDNNKIQLLRKVWKLSSLIRDKRLDNLAKLSFDGHKPGGYPHQFWYDSMMKNWKPVDDMGWHVEHQPPPDAAGKVWSLNISECGGKGMSLDQLLEFMDYKGKDPDQINEPHRVTWRWSWTHYGLYNDPNEKGCWLWYGYLPQISEPPKAPLKAPVSPSDPPPHLKAAWEAFNSARTKFGKKPFLWSDQLAAAAQEGADYAAMRTAMNLTFEPHHDMGGRLQRAGWEGSASEGQFGGWVTTSGIKFPDKTPEYLANQYAEAMVMIGFGQNGRPGDMEEGHVADYRSDFQYAGIGMKGGHFVVNYGDKD